MIAAYLPAIAEAAINDVTVAGSDGAINDSGARKRVHATGVGAPRSDSTVTTASPIPSWVSSSSRSYPDLGKVDTVAFKALASSGV